MADQMPGLLQDRLKRSIAAFIRELWPTIDYQKPHLYQVLSWDYGAQTGSLAPSASASGMPALNSVPIRSSALVDLPDGFSVVVCFDNGSPTAPFISHLSTQGEGNQLDGLDL